MELHELIQKIKEEHVLAKERSLEGEYWFGRYALTKELLLIVDRERRTMNLPMCIHCFDKNKKCEKCL